MNYIIHYDIAAVAIAVVTMGFFLYKRNIQSLHTRVFGVLVILGLFTSVCDVISVYFINNVEKLSLFGQYFINEMYLITFNAIPVVYFFYLLLAEKTQREFTKFDYVRMIIPFGVDFILILTTPWTHLVFYFDENRFYTHGNGMLILYGVAFFYMGMAIVDTFRYRSRLNWAQKAHVYFYSVVCFGAAIAQFFVSGLIVSQFAVSIALLLLFLSLENPTNYLDNQLQIYNKEAFIVVGKEMIRKKKAFRIIGLPFTGLKFMNETIGIENKEEVLKQISHFLQDLNGISNAFHYSGTRFLVVLEDNEEKQKELTEKIQEFFGKPIPAGSMSVTLSVPIITFRCPEEISGIEDVLDIIEYSLFEVSGDKNEIVETSVEILEKKRWESQVLSVMKEAIRRKEFEVYYQPIYSVERGKYTTAEALVRMPRTKLGFVGPDVFIPMAEKNGMILEIGEIVFRKICEFITTQKLWEKGIEYVHVNLSVVQCMQDTLHEQLLSIMDEWKLPYKYVNLEVTETAAVVSSDTLKSNMNKLMGKGIEFALDDYGTGFSNTSSLIKYPFHTIKLDKSMVWAAMEDKKAMCALEHTISMVKAMDMEIVAEGVETKEQAEILQKMGCDFFQGFYYSRPVPEKDYLNLLAEA